MIHHKLENGDEYSVGKNTFSKKVLVQLSSDKRREQTRVAFTPKEAREMIDKIIIVLREIEKKED
jgi:hypothetical protein